MSRLSGKVVTTLFFVLFLAVLLKNAWLGDDAYITFRTVDNFINGYGLTWNTVERVQAYTHPLWLFMLSGLYFFSHEIYYTSLSRSKFHTQTPRGSTSAIIKEATP